MVRTVKEYAVRRNEILDAAQRLVYTVGYEQMTIQNIMDDLQISKGAFYHYFGSKQALLEALIERMMQDAEQVLMPVVDDPLLPALAKLQHFFDVAARWKTARKTFLLALLRVWYTDDNAVVRQKVTAAGVRRMAPLITAIIRQGIRESNLSPPCPDQIGEVIFAVLFGLGDSMAAMILSKETNADSLQRLENTVAAYTDAVERILGAPKGSLSFVDNETLKEWMVST